MAAVDTNASPHPTSENTHIVSDSFHNLERTAVPGSAAPFLAQQYAAQPDVVLSQDRDSYYADTLLGESASELLETLIGSRRTTILGPELRALASCLYFGLTSFVGKQTLGQEYCGIALARSGDHSRRLGLSSSATTSEYPNHMSQGAFRLYTLIRVVVPYLQERMREGWYSLNALWDPFGRVGGGTRGAAATLAAHRARARARAAALAPPVGIGVTSPATEPPEASTRNASGEETHDTLSQPAMESEGEEVVRAGGDVVDAGRTPNSMAPSSSLPPPPRRAPQTRARRARSVFTLAALDYLRRALAWVRRKRPAMSGVLEWLLRLHLVAFYFDGRYANVAMRAIGARLTYTGENEPPGARYAILGLFLLLQVIGEAASAAALRFSTDRVAAGDLGRGTMGDAGGAGEEEDVAETRVPAVMKERTPADVALFPRSRRKCSLCMSARENVAATPCGHLFCWECVVGWCQTNPECPLCRQPATPQAIVCLYQYA